MANKSLIILFLLLLSFVSVAQISGTITDSETKSALADVEIIELKTGTNSFTDRQGYFNIDISNQKETQLVIYKDGYQVLDFIIETIEDHYFISINPLAVELSQIELTEQRKEIFATRKLKNIEGTSIYAGKKTEVVMLDLLNANLASNVSRQVYAQISGLNIYEGSDGGLQLNIGGRGLDPNRTSNFNTRQNGYDISADVLGYPENYYTPPSEALEEIRIIRGASSLQYGTQFGGLIDFKIRKIPSFRKWDIQSKQTYGSYQFFNSFNSIGFHKDKISVDAFYNFKRGNGYRDNSQFKAHNAFVSTHYQISQKADLELEFTYMNYLAKQAGGLTDMQFASTPRLSTRDRNWFAVDWKLYNLKYHYNFTKDQKLEFNLFALDASRKSIGFRGNPIALNENPILSLDEKDSDGNYINERDLIDGRFRNIGAEVRYLSEYQIKNKLATYLVGLKFYKSNNTSVQGPGTSGTDADFSLQTEQFPDYANQSNFIFPNLNVATFIENIFFINKKLTITPGLRFEYIKTKSEGTYQEVIFDLAGNPIANQTFADNQELSRQFIIGGIGIDYQLSKKAKLTFNLTQNYRSVTFSDIRVVNPSYIVDENITDEKGLSLNAGITGRIKSRFSYDFNCYSILYNERIGIILDDRANRKRTNIGDAIIAGTESLLNFIPIRIVKQGERIFELKAFLNSSFTYSKYLNSKSNNVVGNTVEFIPEINLKSGLSMNYKGLKASIQHSFVSQQFTDAQNSLIPADGDFRSGIIGEIPSYQIMDLNLSYAWKQMSIETGINNLTDSSYFTRRATGYPGPGIIPSEGRTFYVTLGYLFQE